MPWNSKSLHRSYCSKHQPKYGGWPKQRRKLQQRSSNFNTNSRQAEEEVKELQRSEDAAKREEITIRQRLGPSVPEGSNALEALSRDPCQVSRSFAYQVCLCRRCPCQTGAPWSVAICLGRGQCCPSRDSVPDRGGTSRQRRHRYGAYTSGDPDDWSPCSRDAFCALADPRDCECPQLGGSRRGLHERWRVQLVGQCAAAPPCARRLVPNCGNMRPHSGRCQYRPCDCQTLSSSMQTPQIQRCHNPWCATRVGEARVPGPPIAKRPSHQSPKREGRRRIRSKGPAASVASVGITDTPDSAEVDTLMTPATESALPAPPPLSVPAEEGPSQAPGDTTSYPMLFVHTVDETHLKLRCYYIHANSCWRWQTSGRGAVLSRSSRKSPVEALRAWQKRYSAQLTEESRIEVQNALSIMDDSPQMATPPRKGASQLSMLSDAAPSQVPVEDSDTRPSGVWVPPPQGTCARMLAKWNEWVYAMDKPTMRKLPRSTHQLLAQTLDWLVKLVEDLDQPDVVRDTAELLVLCAPTLLWPVPARPDGAQKLLPHSRVKSIKARCHLVATGQWEELLVLACHRHPRHADTGPHAAGVVTEAEADAILRAGRRGAPAAAWRRLHSFGIAGCNATTLPNLQERWGTCARALPTSESILRDEAEEVLSDGAVKTMLAGLAQGRAADAFGWNHECFKLFWTHRASSSSMRSFLLHIACAEGSALLLRLSHTCSMVPIYKDLSGNIRPIAIGSIWRKAWAKLCLSKWREQITAKLVPDQFGVGTPDGASAMTMSLQQVAASHEGIAMVKIDLANAFSQVSRSFALECLGAIDPLLAQSQSNWLSSPTHAVMMADDGNTCDLSTSRGIPQGDAMSAATFSLVLQQVMTTVREALPPPLRASFGYHAYVDDCVFWGPKAHIDDLLATISDGLRRADLSINPEKTTFWCPDADPEGLSAFARRKLDEQPRHDGLIVCGQPLWLLDLHDADGAVPVGSTSFVQCFLDARLRAYEHRMASLRAVVDCTSSTTASAHLGYYILTACLLPKWTHLMRCVCPSLLMPTLQRVDQCNLAWVQDLLRTDPFVDDSLCLLQIPRHMGGCDLSCLSRECSAFYVAQELASHKRGTRPCLEDGNWVPRLSSAIAQYTRVAGHPPHTVLKKELSDLQAHGLSRATRQLRTGIHAPLAERLSRSSPASCPPAIDVLAAVARPTAKQFFLALGWLYPVDGNFLPNPAFTTALRRHLGLPVHAAGMHCAYTTLTGHTSCGTLLDRHGHHAASCARGPVMARHNGLRNELMSLLRQAGWHVAIEQQVLISAAAAGTEAIYIRADLTAIAPGGQRVAIDVRVVDRPPSDESTVADHLSRAEAEKLNAYKVQRGARLLPGGELMIPFILHSSGFASNTTGAFLLGLHADLARKWAADMDLSWSESLSRAAATLNSALSCRLQLGQLRVLSACGAVL